tara:strand:- start:897 stop:1199 length:303 start_codon:yes stop_codon:yes gene_type:complete
MGRRKAITMLAAIAIILSVFLLVFWTLKQILVPSHHALSIANLGLTTVGETVTHPKFGTGTITNLQAMDDNDAIVSIEFKKHGLKHLVASQAGLTKPEKP